MHRITIMKQISTSEHLTQDTTFLKFFLILILLGILLLVNYFWDLMSYFSPDAMQAWLTESGRFAPLVYIVVMVIAIVISPIPSLPLDIAAGAFFGPFLGTIYSVIGALVGSVISFLIARFLGRKLVEKLLKGHINFCTICSDKILTKMVFISRLLPMVSFDVVSYGAGLTKMSLFRFSIATFLGMLPLTFVYNYFGSVILFHKGWTFSVGMLIVLFFFGVPHFIEKKNLFPHLHGIKESKNLNKK